MATVLEVGADKTYQTISAALEAAEAMGADETNPIEIVISSGQYVEELRISETNSSYITLKSADPANKAELVGQIIFGDVRSGGAAQPAWDLTDFSIEDLKISYTGTGADDAGNSAITTNGYIRAENFSITNCEINATNGYGIGLQSAYSITNAAFTGNVLTGDGSNGRGIYLYSTFTDAVVSDNDVSKFAHGINIQFSTGNFDVTGNTVSDCTRNGIKVNGGLIQATVTGNDVSNIVTRDSDDAAIMIEVTNPDSVIQIGEDGADANTVVDSGRGIYIARPADITLENTALTNVSEVISAASGVDLGDITIEDTFTVDGAPFQVADSFYYLNPTGQVWGPQEILASQSIQIINEDATATVKDVKLTNTNSVDDADNITLLQNGVFSGITLNTELNAVVKDVVSFELADGAVKGSLTFDVAKGISSNIALNGGSVGSFAQSGEGLIGIETGAGFVQDIVFTTGVAASALVLGDNNLTADGKILVSGKLTAGDITLTGTQESISAGAIEAGVITAGTADITVNKTVLGSNHLVAESIASANNVMADGAIKLTGGAVITGDMTANGAGVAEGEYAIDLGGALLAGGAVVSGNGIKAGSIGTSAKKVASVLANAGDIAVAGDVYAKGGVTASAGSITADGAIRTESGAVYAYGDLTASAINTVQAGDGADITSETGSITTTAGNIKAGTAGTIKAQKNIDIKGVSGDGSDGQVVQAKAVVAVEGSITTSVVTDVRNEVSAGTDVNVSGASVSAGAVKAQNGAINAANADIKINADTDADKAVSAGTDIFAKSISGASSVTAVAGRIDVENAVSATGDVTAGADIEAGSVSGANVSATAIKTTAGDLVATGNVVASEGAVEVAGDLKADGDITGAGVTAESIGNVAGDGAAGNITSTGKVETTVGALKAGNINAEGQDVVSAAELEAGDITAQNVNAATSITASGTVTATGSVAAAAGAVNVTGDLKVDGDISGDGVSAASIGNVAGDGPTGNITSIGKVETTVGALKAGNINAEGQDVVSAAEMEAADITAGNVKAKTSITASGTVTATGDVSALGGALKVGGDLKVDGNIKGDGVSAASIGNVAGDGAAGMIESTGRVETISGALKAGDIFAEGQDVVSAAEMEAGSIIAQNVEAAMGITSSGSVTATGYVDAKDGALNVADSLNVDGTINGAGVTAGSIGNVKGDGASGAVTSTAGVVATTGDLKAESIQANLNGEDVNYDVSAVNGTIEAGFISGAGVNVVAETIKVADHIGSADERVNSVVATGNVSGVPGDIEVGMEEADGYYSGNVYANNEVSAAHDLMAGTVEAGSLKAGADLFVRNVVAGAGGVTSGKDLKSYSLASDGDVIAKNSVAITNLEKAGNVTATDKTVVIENVNGTVGAVKAGTTVAITNIGSESDPAVVGTVASVEAVEGIAIENIFAGSGITGTVTTTGSDADIVLNNVAGSIGGTVSATGDVLITDASGTMADVSALGKVTAGNINKVGTVTAGSADADAIAIDNLKDADALLAVNGGINVGSLTGTIGAEGSTDTVLEGGKAVTIVGTDPAAAIKGNSVLSDEDDLIQATAVTGNIDFGSFSANGDKLVDGSFNGGIITAGNVDKDALLSIEGTAFTGENEIKDISSGMTAAGAPATGTLNLKNIGGADVNALDGTDITDFEKVMLQSSLTYTNGTIGMTAADPNYITTLEMTNPAAGETVAFGENGVANLDKFILNGNKMVLNAATAAVTTTGTELVDAGDAVEMTAGTMNFNGVTTVASTDFNVSGADSVVNFNADGSDADHPGALLTGTITAASDSSVNFNGAFTNVSDTGLIDADAGAKITFAGANASMAGKIDANDSAILFSGDSATVSGTIDGFNNSSVIFSAANALVDGGTITVDGESTLEFQQAFTVEGGTLTAKTSSWIKFTGAGTLNNAVITLNDASQLELNASTDVNGGSITVNSNSLIDFRDDSSILLNFKAGAELNLNTSITIDDHYTFEAGTKINVSGPDTVVTVTNPNVTVDMVNITNDATVIFKASSTINGLYIVDEKNLVFENKLTITATGDLRITEKGSVEAAALDVKTGGRISLAPVTGSTDPLKFMFTIQGSVDGLSADDYSEDPVKIGNRIEVKVDGIAAGDTNVYSLTQGANLKANLLKVTNGGEEVAVGFADEQKIAAVGDMVYVTKAAISTDKMILNTAYTNETVPVVKDGEAYFNGINAHSAIQAAVDQITADAYTAKDGSMYEQALEANSQYFKDVKVLEVQTAGATQTFVGNVDLTGVNALTITSDDATRFFNIDGSITGASSAVAGDLDHTIENARFINGKYIGTTAALDGSIALTLNNVGISEVLIADVAGSVSGSTTITLSENSTVGKLYSNAALDGADLILKNDATVGTVDFSNVANAVITVDGCGIGTALIGDGSTELSIVKGYVNGFVSNVRSITIEEGGVLGATISKVGSITITNDIYNEVGSYVLATGATNGTAITVNGTALNLGFNADLNGNYAVLMNDGSKITLNVYSSADEVLTVKPTETQSADSYLFTINAGVSSLFGVKENGITIDFGADSDKFEFVRSDNGTFVYRLTDNTLKNFSYTVTAEDIYGNKIVSDPVSEVAVKDYTAPVVDGVLSAVQADGAYTFALSGLAFSDNFGIANVKVEVINAAGEVIGTYSGATADEAFAAAAAFDGKEYAGKRLTFKVTGTDAAGHSVEVLKSVTVADSADPVWSGSLAAVQNDGYVFHLEGAAASDDVGVVKYLLEIVGSDGKVLESLESATMPQATMDLAKYAGQNLTVKLTAFDAAGKSSVISTDISVADKTAPELPVIAEIRQDADGYGFTLVVSGKDNVGVKSFTVSYSLDNGASWMTTDGVAAVNGVATINVALTAADADKQVLFKVTASDGVNVMESPVTSLTVVDKDAPVFEGTLSAVQNSDYSASLSGVAATDNSGVVKYLLELVDENGNTVSSVESTTLPTTVSNLAAYIGRPMTVRITAYDKTGNSSSVSADLAVKDVTNPEEVVVDSIVQSNGYDFKVVVSGRDNVAIEKFVLVFDGVEYTQLASGNKAIFEFSVGADKANTTVDYKVTAYDKAGNSFDVSKEQYIADYTAPEVTGAFAVAQKAGTYGLDVTAGEYKDNSDVTKSYEIYDGNTLVGTDLAADFSAYVGKTLTVVETAKDAAGNVTKQSATVTFADVTRPEEVVVDSVVQSNGYDFKVVVSGRDNVAIEKFVLVFDGVEYTQLASGNKAIFEFSVGADKANTTVDYKVTAYDKAGNSFDVSKEQYIADYTAPEVTGAFAVAQKAGTYGLDVTAGEYKDNSDVTKSYEIYDGNTLVGTDLAADFSAYVGKTLTVVETAKDAAGNVTKQSATVTFADVTAPDLITVDSFVQASGYAFTVTVSGRDNIAIDKFVLTVNGQTYEQLATNNQAVFHFTGDATMAGKDIEYTIVASDKAGNSSTITGVFDSPVADTTSPVILSTSIVQKKADATESGFGFEIAIAATDNLTALENMTFTVKVYSQNGANEAAMYTFEGLKYDTAIGGVKIELPKVSYDTQFWYTISAIDGEGNSSTTDFVAFTAAGEMGDASNPEKVFTGAQEFSQATTVLSGYLGAYKDSDNFKLTTDIAGVNTLTISGVGAGEKAKITIVNADGKKKSYTVTEKNKTWVINDVLMAAGTSTITIESTNKKMNVADYEINVNTTFFGESKYNTPDSANTEFFATGDESRTNTTTDWVGYGDAKDYYKITSDHAGSYTINLQATTGKVKVYFLNESGKTIKSKTISAGKSGEIANVLYYSKNPINGQNVSYIAVESGDKGKGKQNGSYTLTVTENVFSKGDNGAVRDFGAVGGGETTMTDWLGYGDAQDVFKFTADSNGILSLDISKFGEDIDLDKIKLKVQDANGKTVAMSKVKGSSIDTGFQYNSKKTLIAGSEYTVTLSISNEKKYKADYSLGLAIV